MTQGIVFDKMTLNKDQLKELSMIDVSQRRIKTPDNFYAKKEWKELSKTLLKNYPVCEICIKEGHQSPSKKVHHIVPISKGGSELSEENLICLCESCHKEVHSLIGVRISPQFFLDALNEDLEDEWIPHPNLEHHDNQTIRYLWMNAREMEKEAPEEALKIYKKIFTFLERYDAWCKRHTSELHRNTNFPIDRITLLLEKLNRYEECLKFIERYGLLNDPRGIGPSVIEALNNRKKRIVKKMDKTLSEKAL